MNPLFVIAAGIVAIAIGTLLLRSYGPRVRVGRLLAVTPVVTLAAARDLASTGTRRYVRIDGRLDADDEFPDEHDRPLVFRRRRVEALAEAKRDQLATRLPPETPVRLRIEQLSSVEHASVLGVPVIRADGAVQMTAGTGRPLVVCTLERQEAMRVIANGARTRPIAAAVALASGLALLVAGIGWALVAGATA